MQALFMNLVPRLVMQINFRIRSAFAKFFKVIASHRFDRSLFRIFAFASQIRVFAFSHRYFMAIFSGKFPC
jgi:hypothetical protein